VTPLPEADGTAPEPDRGAAQSAAAGPADPAQAARPDAIDPAAIAAELQALRRGYGMLGDVTGRIGPLLWELAAGARRVAVADNVPGVRSDAAEGTSRPTKSARSGWPSNLPATPGLIHQAEAALRLWSPVGLVVRG
jgi:hypothetical protein